MSKMAATATKALPPIIQDEMQKRRMMKRATTTVPKFQTRIFVLYKHQLVYKTKDGKQTRGSISIMGIKICEDVEECSFNRPHVFQVGYLEKGKMFHLYIQAKDHDMRETWKFHIRKLCSTYNDHRMQQRYHPGHYKKDKWSCCANDDKNNIGCRQAYLYDGPQPLGEACPSSLTLPISSTSLHKTPVLHRADPKHRVNMPSDCYDSDEIDDLLVSPTPSPQLRDKVLVGSPERKCLPSDYLANRGSKARYSLQPEVTYSPKHSPTPCYKFEHKKYSLLKRAQSEDQSGSGYNHDASSHGRHSVSDFRAAYFGKSDDTYLVIRKTADRTSVMIDEVEEETETEKDSATAPLSSQSMRYTSRYAPGTPGGSIYGVSDSGTDVGLSMSTPYYCPINTGPIKDISNTRLYSVSSSTAANAGSDRFESFSALSHTSRLDSQGSTIGSSFCESIPRTESDYQKTIEEDGEGSTGPVYTNSSITRSGSAGEVEPGDLMSLMRRDSIRATFEFDMELNEERSQSGTYVNTHGSYT